MFTTLSTALSALNANSTAVSVVGNDLANLNTTGYKTTQVAFQDLMAQSMGGVTGYSLGMGTARPLTLRQFTQGSMQTGLGGLNAAIQGQGFFMVKDGTGNPLYTRDGTFTTGPDGYLVNANGLRVQGWTIGTNGVLNTNGTTGDIPIPSGTLFPPVASTKVSLGMNLNAAAIAGTTTGATSGSFSQPITVYDSLGTAHTLTANFTKNQVQVALGTVAAAPIKSPDTATFTVSTATGVSNPPISIDSTSTTLAGQVADLNTKLAAYGITASINPTTQLLQFASASAFSISGISTGAANLVPSSTDTAVTCNNTALYNESFTPAASGTLNILVGGTTVNVTTTGTASTDVAAINAALLAKGVKGVAAVEDEATAGNIELQGSASFTTNDGTTTTNPTAAADGAQNTWNYAVTMAGSDLTSGTTTTVASGKLTFDPNTGQLLTPVLTDGTVTLKTSSAGPTGALVDGAVMNEISWGLYDSSGNPLVTQVNQPSEVSANNADGSAAAELTSVTMGDSGQLLAQFSNGKSVAVGQLSIANIPNPNSMVAVGNNDFEISSQTVAPIVGTAGTGGRGSVIGGALEQSTVDIAQEFSQLITLQNAYQANSRVVTTENQLLQQTVGLVQP